MVYVCDENMCTGCMACIDICSIKCITIQDTLESYNAIIDEQKCIKCNSCRKVCQSNNKIDEKKPILWKQGWSKDDTIRSNSSSGGVVAELMKTFIQSEGIVYSCILKNGIFQFREVSNFHEIENFVGSKYVKSNPLGIYKKIQNLLKSGKKVLFIGLPCQVAALINYCRNDLLDLLFTVDLICHGSPSPLLLNQFLNENQVNLTEVNNIKFRNKTNYSIFIKNNKKLLGNTVDMYIVAFLKGLDYTENCYFCQYAKLERVSDITVGDSWGSELQEIEKQKGISLILCQSEKGRKLINKSNLYLVEVDLNKAIQKNHQLQYPSKKPKQRKLFFEEIKKGNRFSKAVAKCYPKEYYKQKLKKLFIKFGILSKRNRIFDRKEKV